MACVLHGLTEIVQLIFPGRNFYRQLVAQEDVDSWVLIVSFGILAFSLSYILVLSRLRRDGDIVVGALALAGKTNVWVPIGVWQLLFALPGYLVAVSGENPEDLGYWATGLTDQFLLFGIVLTSTLFLLKRQKWLIPIILVQSGASCDRKPIDCPGRDRDSGVDINETWLSYSSSATHRCRVFGNRFSTCHLNHPRCVRKRGVCGRGIGACNSYFCWVAGGGRDQPEVGTDVADDFIYRFDGNAFAAMISRTSSNRGWPTVGLVTFRNDIFLAVPSFMNRDRSLKSARKSVKRNSI